jgi:iron-sulfur cluster assembly protein
MAEIAEQATAPTGAIIDVTEAAAAKAREVLKDSPHTGIRIAVVGGGCAGLQYDIQPAEKAAEGDLVLVFHDISFFVNPMVVPYIKGMQIDFSNALMDGGFKFINPNATSSCGCGTSFGV